MKFDANALRYLSREELRVLTAVEMGMRNHEIVPSELIERIAGLKRGGAYKNLRTLLRHKLVHHDSQKYDGYRLTNLGYDYLALKTFVNRGIITGVGRQIGTGKESDIFEALSEDGRVLVLKLHRLGRTSFRAVRDKRDYLRGRTARSWLYLSRLAALKEYAFMKALGEHGFPVPEAIDCNRHCVLMSRVDAYPMQQVKELQHPEVVFRTVVGLVVRLAELGLIHCDFNEFNLMINEDEAVTMIDFPQMVSVSHKNAEMYFDRDVDCILNFFQKRFNYYPASHGPEESDESDEGRVSAGEQAEAGGGAEEEWRPLFAAVAGRGGALDRTLEASGFPSGGQAALEAYAAETLTGSEEEEGEDSDVSENEGSELPVCASVEAAMSELRVDKSSHAEEDGVELREGAVNTEECATSVSCRVEERSADAPTVIEDEAEACSDHDHPDEGTGQEVAEGAVRGPHPRRLERFRGRAAAAVKGGGAAQRSSRNAAKDRGGRRSRHSAAAQGGLDSF